MTATLCLQRLRAGYAKPHRPHIIRMYVHDKGRTMKRCSLIGRSFEVRWDPISAMGELNMDVSASAADLLSRYNVKQLFRVKDYHRGVNCLPQICCADFTLRLALHLLLQPCMLHISRSKGLPVAVGDAKPYRILRFATFGQTVTNYKEIARHLCDMWQPGDQMDVQPPEGARGDASAVCWHGLASLVLT